MSLIENTLYGLIDKEKQAIANIRDLNPLDITGKPYYVAYSGGKDSDVIRILCKLAGVPHDLVHNHTTVDAPETVRYVRSIPSMNIEYPYYKGERTNMWRLIADKGIPPTQVVRYCCAVLKEHGGRDRVVMTGVRWAESAKRKNGRAEFESITANRANKIMLNNDNDGARRLMERCAAKGKLISNPIIAWSDADVWEFLHHYGCDSNPLYQCGYKRVGCVGCPMSRKAKQEFERYPKYKAAYIRAFDKMIAVHRAKGHDFPSWHNGVDVFNWWVSGKAMPRQLDGQIDFDDLMEAWE